MHTIRLKRPWKRLVADGQQTDDHLVAKVDVPDLESDLPHAGIVHYQRSFNRPPQLDADEKMVLQIDHFSAQRITIQLNGTVLETHPKAGITFPLQVNLTKVSAAFNQLSLILESPAEQAIQLDGAVCLLIGNRQDFLPNV